PSPPKPARTPVAGRRRKEVPEPPKSPSRSSVALIAIGAVAVIGVVVTLLLMLLPGDSGEEPAAAVPDRTSVRASAGASPGAARREKPPSVAPAPEGFRTHTESGISLAVPKEWTVSVREEAVVFSGPKDSGQRITVRTIADGSLAALQAAEQRL